MGITINVYCPCVYYLLSIYSSKKWAKFNLQFAQTSCRGLEPFAEYIDPDGRKWFYSSNQEKCVIGFLKDDNKLHKASIQFPTLLCCSEELRNFAISHNITYETIDDGLQKHALDKVFSQGENHLWDINLNPDARTIDDLCIPVEIDKNFSISTEDMLTIVFCDETIQKIKELRTLTTKSLTSVQIISKPHEFEEVIRQQFMAYEYTLFSQSEPYPDSEEVHFQTLMSKIVMEYVLKRGLGPSTRQKDFASSIGDYLNLQYENIRFIINCMIKKVRGTLTDAEIDKAKTNPPKFLLRLLSETEILEVLHLFVNAVAIWMMGDPCYYYCKEYVTNIIDYEGPPVNLNKEETIEAVMAICHEFNYVPESPKIYRVDPQTFEVHDTPETLYILERQPNTLNMVDKATHRPSRGITIYIKHIYHSTVPRHLYCLMGRCGKVVKRMTPEIYGFSITHCTSIATIESGKDLLTYFCTPFLNQEYYFCTCEETMWELSRYIGELKANNFIHGDLKINNLVVKLVDKELQLKVIDLEQMTPHFVFGEPVTTYKTKNAPIAINSLTCSAQEVSGSNSFEFTDYRAWLFCCVTLFFFIPLMHKSRRYGEEFKDCIAVLTVTMNECLGGNENEFIGFFCKLVDVDEEFQFKIATYIVELYRKLCIYGVPIYVVAKEAITTMKDMGLQLAYIADYKYNKLNINMPRKFEPNMRKSIKSLLNDKGEEVCTAVDMFYKTLKCDKENVMP